MADRRRSMITQTETLRQLTIRIPTDSDMSLRVAVKQRGLRSRQALIEPVIEDFSAHYNPIVVQGLQALISEFIGETPFDQKAATEMVRKHEETLSETFPMSPVDIREPYVNTGIRITKPGLLNLRVLAIIEGHTAVSPRVESAVNGHIQNFLM